MLEKFSLSEKIFLAGARGLAGSAIHRSLINKGYGNKKNGGKLYTPSSKELNLLDLKSVINWFDTYKPTVVIIAAAKVGGINANKTYPADFLLENIKIQNNVIETAWKYGVKRLLFLGSSCIYPKFSNQPIKEEYLLNGSLESTNEFYAIAKISGIKLCESLRIQYGFDAICLMPTNLYGPEDNYDSENSHVFPALIRKFYEAKQKSLKTVTCWGSGLPRREFLHSDDLAEACIFALKKFNPSEENSLKDKEGNNINFLNVGTGKDITIKELSEKIANKIGFSGEILWDKSMPDGTFQKKLDVSRINSLGWESKINLDIGIRNTVQDFAKLINKKN